VPYAGATLGCFRWASPAGRALYPLIETPDRAALSSGRVAVIVNLIDGSPGRWRWCRYLRSTRERWSICTSMRSKRRSTRSTVEIVRPHHECDRSLA
jgi:hypothetical protein